MISESDFREMRAAMPSESQDVKPDLANFFLSVPKSEKEDEIVKETKGTPAERPIKTSCKDCVFAEFTVCSGHHLQDGGITQTGCKAGRLEKYIKLDVAERVYPEDESKIYEDYYEITGFCGLCRNRDWLDNNFPEGSPDDDIVLALAKQENTQQFDVIVVYDGESTFDDLRDTLRSLASQKLRPKNIVVVSHNAVEHPVYIYNTCLGELEGKDIQVSVETIMVPVGQLSAIDLGVRRCVGNYYSLCIAGHEYPENFFSSIEYAINEDLKRLLVVTPDEETGNGLTISLPFHKMLGGNQEHMPDEEGSVIAKACKMLKEHKCLQMITTFQEISRP